MTAALPQKREQACTSGAPVCRLCGARAWRDPLVARERQFGIPGEFTYASCGACGGLQLLDPPADLAPYYPGDYYSLAPAGGHAPRGWLRERAALFQVTGRGLVGRVFARLRMPAVPTMAHWLARVGATPDTRILDVGCGWGELLRNLGASGYRRLTGVDPFLPTPGRVGPVELVRSTLEALAGADRAPRFDLVMIHHALEHVPEPRETLSAARRLLAPGGHCLIRVPVVPSRAFSCYGAHWVQLDAPRHLFLPSAEGMRALAAAAGLAVERVAYDSTAFQFWGSELYLRGVPLVDPAVVPPRPRPEAASGFAPDELAAWRAEARALNAREDGDQACFYLRAASPASVSAPASADGFRPPPSA